MINTIFKYSFETFRLVRKENNMMVMSHNFLSIQVIGIKETILHTAQIKQLINKGDVN